MSDHPEDVEHPTEDAVPLEEVLEAHAPAGEAAAYLAALRRADDERYATAVLGSIAHVAAGEPTDGDQPDPELAEARGPSPPPPAPRHAGHADTGHADTGPVDTGPPTTP